MANAYNTPAGPSQWAPAYEDSTYLYDFSHYPRASLESLRLYEQKVATRERHWRTREILLELDNLRSQGDSARLNEQFPGRRRMIEELVSELESLKRHGDSGDVLSRYPQAGPSPHHMSVHQESNPSQHCPVLVGSQAYPLYGNNQHIPQFQEQQIANSSHRLGLHVPGRDNFVQETAHDRPKRLSEAALPAPIYPRLYDANDAFEEEYLARGRATFTGDRFVTRHVQHSPTAETPARHSRETIESEEPSSRKLVRALDERYRYLLNAEPGHRFDNVDDTVIAAYIDAGDRANDSGESTALVIGSQQEWPDSHTGHMHIPFLRLKEKVLHVHMPLDRESVTGLANDILRVVYVFLSNRRPMFVSAASLTESHWHVLYELESRGFTAKLPHVDRLLGLGDAPRYDQAQSSRAPALSGDPVRQTSREQLPSPTNPEASQKKKGKAPVCACSYHLSAASSSDTVETEQEDTSSEDSTPRAKGKTPAIETPSHDSSDNSVSTEGEDDAESATPAKRREGISDQKSDY